MAAELTLNAGEAERATTGDCEQARLYLDAVGMLLVGLAADHTVIFANRAVCAMLEIEESELIGRDWPSIAFKATEQDRVRQLMNRLADGGCESSDLGQSAIPTPKGERLIAWHHTVACNTSGVPVATISSGEDVTEREIVQSDFRRAQQRLALAVWAGNVGLWDWDLSTDEVYYSPEWKAQLGYSDDEIGTTFSEWADRVHPDDLQRVRVVIDSCVRGERTEFAQEFRMLHKCGSYRWILAQATMIRDQTGRTTRILGSHVEITHNKKTEVAAAIVEGLHKFASNHTLEELLQETLDQAGSLLESPLGFYHFVGPDEQTLVLQAWSSATRETYCKMSAAGMKYSIHDAGVWADCVRQRQVIVHNDYAALPGRTGLPDGHACVVRELVVPIFRADRIVAILGLGNKACDYSDLDVQLAMHIADVAWDVAEQKRADEALRASEERFRLSLAFSPEPVFLVRNQVFVYANAAGLELLGAQEDELLGTPILDRVRPEFHDAAVSGISILKAPGAVMPLREIAAIRMDGSSLDLEVTATLIEMPEGPTVELVTRDITQRKEAEGWALRHQRRLTELAGELLRSGERERRRVAVELHDGVGQALAVAKMNAQTIASSNPPDAFDTEAAEQLVIALEHAIECVRAITSELSPPLLHAFGLGAALERLAENFLHRYGVSCELTVDPRAGKLKNDAGILLHRAATELLNNVQRHSGAKSASLNVSLEGRTVMLRVQDRGRGFDSRTVLDEDNSHDRFGLFSIREEIALVGGSTVIESEPGIGTIVEVRVPCGLNWSQPPDSPTQ